MIYNRELAKRFISDYKLPIPLIKEEYFFYHLNLYEKDYGALTKYTALIDYIDKQYGGDCERFLEEYYHLRDTIITTIEQSEAFKKFNTMDLNCYSITNKPNISSNNIYNREHIGKFFITVDLKKANFQVLKKIDKDIVLNSDTYEEFIGKFTDSEYVKKSKYTRQVVFGKLNPKRHITIEKYYTCILYKKILGMFPQLEGKCVSLSNDEIVFKDSFIFYDDKFTCQHMRKKIEELSNGIGFDVRVEFYHLRGYNLLYKDSRSVRNTFYKKDFVYTDAKFKLISLPLPYHSIAYKLYNNLPLDEIDYHFDYEGMDAKLCEEFDIEEVV